MTRREPARHLTRAESVAAVELAGVLPLNMLSTASTKQPGPVTMSFTWKHPNYWKKLKEQARLQAQASPPPPTSKFRLQAQAKDHAGDKHNPQANQEPAVQGSNPVQPVPGSENPGKDSN